MMKTNSLNPSFRLDRGLDMVFDLPADEVSLPPPSTLRPPQMHFTEQIDSLLHPLSINDYLRVRLEPHVSDNVLLSPPAFRQVLNDVAAKLRANPSLPGGKAALQIIESDLALRDLLALNKNALLQG